MAEGDLVVLADEAGSFGLAEAVLAELRDAGSVGFETWAVHEALALSSAPTAFERYRTTI